MPLADGLRSVACGRKQLGHRDFTLQAAALASHRRAMQTVTVGHAAGSQRCARRRAGRLGVTRGELQAVSGDLVEIGRRRADLNAAAIATEIAPADVVHQEDENVRLLLPPLQMLRELRLRRLDLML